MEVMEFQRCKKEVLVVKAKERLAGEVTFQLSHKESSHAL